MQQPKGLSHIGDAVVTHLVWLFAGIRYAVLLGVPAYFVAFLAFAATVSYIQHHGGPVSSLPSEMKSDRLLGLLAAVTVASLELECLAFLLSKRWSTTATIGLLLGGVSSVALAYVGSVIPARTSGATEGF